MKWYGRRLPAILICFSALLFSNFSCALDKHDSGIPKRITPADVQYLKTLAHDTWNCIDYMVDPKSQLPYDNMHKNEWTSVTNIGLYVAALSAAVDMGFVPREAAKERLEKMLTNLGVFAKWNGFTQSWNSVWSGVQAPHDPWLSTLDSGNLYAGLMVGRGFFPELKDQFSEQIDAADWSKLYNPETKKMRFGYNFKTQVFGGDLSDLGADSQLACFLAIANNKAPLDCWTTLNRNLEERYGYQYLQPGWQGGGLFMQYISGIMLDERHTFLGLAAANFAYAQILHARKNKFPVWGWSASEAPTGEYLGMNALKDNVITPHACVLAIQHYPTEVIANLKALEKLGARKPFPSGKANVPFGFRDSIDLETKGVANDYLMLDQCMLFLSLANFVDNGFVWNSFRKNPGVEEAYAKIPDLKAKELGVSQGGEAVGAEEEFKDLKRTDVFELRDSEAKLDKDPYKTILEPNHFVKYFIIKGKERTFANWAEKPVKLDGDLSEWAKAEWISLDQKKDAETLRLSKPSEASASFSYMWDDKYLYFAAKVRCDELVFKKKGADMWKDDAIELYLSPDAHDFVWGRHDVYQIGLVASGPEGKPQSWAWFQDGHTDDHVKIFSKMGDTMVDGKRGYILEAAIEWEFLNITPHPALMMGSTPGFHFVDAKHENEVKLLWCFMPDGKSLGELILRK